MIHKIILSVIYNKWLKCLNTQPNKLTNQNSLKFPKLLGQRIRTRYYKTLGTRVINIPLSHLSLCHVLRAFDCNTTPNFKELCEIYTISFYDQDLKIFAT